MHHFGLNSVKIMKQTYFSLIALFIFLNPSCSKLQNAQNGSLTNTVEEIHVGVILDMGSWTGKIGHSIISMAISDFYALNSYYKTRLVLHTKDSKGEPLRALSEAINLLENINLQAIIGVETSIEAKILAELGDKAEVPIISFLAIDHSLTLTEYPYFVQFTQVETSQVEGIAAIVKAFSWKEVILVYLDTDHGREFIPYMMGSFQDINIRVAYRIAIDPLSKDGQILEQLYKLMTLRTTVIVVHLSPSLASLLFLNAKRLGMMSKGYVWIVTDKTMNFIHAIDSSVIESMQGVLGFKPYIPASKELRDFCLRWRRRFLTNNQDIEVKDLNVYGLWAYDTVWALAKAAERVRIRISESKKQVTTLNMMDLATIKTSKSGSIVLNETLQSRFRGLSGEIQLIDGKLISKGYEIVNVIGKRERTVGFWTPTNGIMKEMNLPINKKNAPSPSDLEVIIWPGGSATVPKGWVTRMSGKKLRIGVPMIHGFHELVKVDRQTNSIIVTGFCIDVFKEAIATLPYEVPYQFIPFENANGEMAGTYTDLIDQVYLQNYDAVVGDMTITANRSLYVDFTLPFTDVGVGMIVPITNNNNMWVFLKPLTPGLWLTSAAFFVFTGFVIWLIEHPINDEFQGTPATQIGMIFWYSFSTQVFAHREKLISNLSKFVVTIWVFVVLILSSSYTATLSSMFTVQQIQLASKDYIGYPSNSPVRGAISNLNFEGSRLKRYNSLEDYADALSRGSKNGGVSAIIDEIPYIKLFLARYSAHYTMINPMPTTNGFGFAFPKGSPLVSEISTAIARLREEGKLIMLEEQWFKSQPTLPSLDSTSSPNSALNLHEFGGLFIISAISSTLALVIYLGFSLYEKWQGARNCNFPQVIRGHLEMVKIYFT